MNNDYRKPTLRGAGVGFLFGAWIGYKMNTPAPFAHLLLTPWLGVNDNVSGKKNLPPVKKFNKDVILMPLAVGIIFACVGAGVGSLSALTYRSIKHKFAKKPVNE